jgi:hypothetical protein
VAGTHHATDEVVIALESEMELEVDGTVPHPKLGEESPTLAGVVHSA